MDLTSEPILVPESLAADHLLDRLREEETMAIVLDEYGDTVGIVTLEDIVEEVVGSVSDEHDTHERDPLVALDPTADGRPRWQADGIIRTDQLASLGLPAPTDATKPSPASSLIASTESRCLATGSTAMGGCSTSKRSRTMSPNVFRSPDRTPPTATHPIATGPTAVTVVQLVLGALTLVSNYFFVGGEFA